MATARNYATELCPLEWLSSDDEHRKVSFATPPLASQDGSRYEDLLARFQTVVLLQTPPH